MSENEYVHFLSILSLADAKLRAEAEACLEDLNDENFTSCGRARLWTA
jgi:hypothetical protein